MPEKTTVKNLDGNQLKTIEVENSEIVVVCNCLDADPTLEINEYILEKYSKTIIDELLKMIKRINGHRAVIVMDSQYQSAFESLKEAIAQNQTAIQLEIKLVENKMMLAEPSALITYLERGKALGFDYLSEAETLSFEDKPVLVISGETLINQNEDGIQNNPKIRCYQLTGEGIEKCIVEDRADLKISTLLEKNNINLESVKGVCVGGWRGQLLNRTGLEVAIADNLTGGIQVFTEKNCIVDFMKQVLEILKSESCGTCALCRQGLLQIFFMIKDITAKKGRTNDVKDMLEIAEAMSATANCDFGKNAAALIISAVVNFEDEFEKHIDRGRCDALVCKKMITYHILGEKCQGCGACYSICPHNAIAGSDNMIHLIDQEKCDQCGDCLTECNKAGYQAIVAAGGVKPKTPVEPVPVGSFKKQGLGLRGKKKS
jgi:NADH-quinone oxidoreductase subunit F